MTQIPDRLIRLLRTCEADERNHFPPTEVFNETWMLRLVLDAFQTLDLQHGGFRFLPGAKWYSEALLSSAFRPQARPDTLGEGLTNADAVIGDFEVGERRPLRLMPGCRQFLVVEAKMFSNFSAGVRYAPKYNQAARSVACMAAAIQHSGKPLNEFDSLGFLVIAPVKHQRRNGYSNLEEFMRPEKILAAVSDRVSAYEAAERTEAACLRSWHDTQLSTLVEHLANRGHLSVLSWEDLIEIIQKKDPLAGAEVQHFYDRCLSYRSFRLAETTGATLFEALSGAVSDETPQTSPGPEVQNAGF